LLPYGGGKVLVEPPLTHCVADTRVEAPAASERSSVNAARDGGGATTMSTAFV